MSGEKGYYIGQSVLSPSGSGSSQIKSLSADKTDAGTATLSAISGVTLNIVNGATYAIDAFGTYDADVTVGAALDLNGGTATVSYIKAEAMYWDGGASPNLESPITALNTKTGGVFSASSGSISIRGLLICNGSGTLIPRWAVFQAGAGNAKLYKNFWMKLTQI